jgi:hypothetical protein
MVDLVTLLPYNTVKRLKLKKLTIFRKAFDEKLCENEFGNHFSNEKLFSKENCPIRTFSFVLNYCQMVVDRMRNFSYDPLSIGWGLEK